jgi:hypothetical protein
MFEDLTLELFAKFVKSDTALAAAVNPYAEGSGESAAWEFARAALVAMEGDY